MEDDLMRIFGGDRMQNVLATFQWPEDEPIIDKMFTGAIERAQKRVEENNFGIRKHLLDYDQVMNEQRETIYAERRRVHRRAARRTEGGKNPRQNVSRAALGKRGAAGKIQIRLLPVRDDRPRVLGDEHRAGRQLFRVFPRLCGKVGKQFGDRNPGQPRKLAGMRRVNDRNARGNGDFSHREQIQRVRVENERAALFFGKHVKNGLRHAHRAFSRADAGTEHANVRPHCGRLKDARVGMARVVGRNQRFRQLFGENDAVFLGR